MGGRGSAGGTQSTYRGNSTALFKAKNGGTPSSSKPGGGGGNGGGGGGAGKGAGNTGTGGVKNPGGGGKGTGSGGGGGSNLPPKPQTWPDNLRKKADARRETEQQIADDIVAVNPRHNEHAPGDPNIAMQWNINCTRCAATVEMRARGYDVTALPKPYDVKDNNYKNSSDKWLDSDGKHREFEFLTMSRDQLKQELNLLLLEHPEGSRGLIRTTWAQGGGHIFNWEIRDGKVVYRDGQPNQPEKGDSWIDTVSKYGHDTAILRVDDLTPSEDILKWVRPRTSEEINAPLRRELTEEMKRLGYQLGEPVRDAFTAGWQAIRAGIPIDHQKYSNPDIQSAYESGVLWARRPD